LSDPAVGRRSHIRRLIALYRRMTVDSSSKNFAERHAGKIVLAVVVLPYVAYVLYNKYHPRGPEWHQGEWQPLASNQEVVGASCYFKATCDCNARNYACPADKVHERPESSITVRGDAQPAGDRTICRWRQPFESCEFCVDKIDCTNPHLDPSVRRMSCCVP